MNSFLKFSLQIVFFASTTSLFASDLTPETESMATKKQWVDETKKYISLDKEAQSSDKEAVEKEADHGDIESLESLAIFLDKKFALNACQSELKKQGTYFSCFQNMYYKKIAFEKASPRFFKVVYDVGLKALAMDLKNDELNKAELGLKVLEDMGTASFTKQAQLKFVESFTDQVVKDIERSLLVSDLSQQRSPASASTEVLRLQTYKERLIRIKGKR